MDKSIYKCVIMHKRHDVDADNVYCVMKEIEVEWKSDSHDSLMPHLAPMVRLAVRVLGPLHGLEEDDYADIIVELTETPISEQPDLTEDTPTIGVLQ